MLIKSIFDPIDRLIVQAKGYIQEQDVRKKYLKQVEEKIVIIKPELDKRKEELNDLINQIDSDDDLREKLDISLRKLDSYIENIELVAEKELALTIMPLENEDSYVFRKKSRDYRSYINRIYCKSIK